MITPSFAITATERVLPRLALDFTTASLDSRITLTRTGNTATVTNSSGYVVPINADLPRFDYNPTTLACKGLLIEETRTNVATYSEDFLNTATAGSARPWIWTRSTVTPDAAIAPSNIQVADKIVEDTSTGTHFISVVPAFTSGATYSYSIYAKASERSVLVLQLQTSAFNTTPTVWFNLAAGTVSKATGTSTNTITPVGNGWYRCSVVATATATVSATIYHYLDISPTGSASYTGNGTSGLFIWGAQLETGMFPTSYIPTVASQVTRAPDEVSMTGTNFSNWFNSSEGAFFVQANTLTLGTASAVYAGVNGVANDNNRIQIAYANASASCIYRISANGVAANPANTLATKTGFKAVLAYKVGTDQAAGSSDASTPTTSSPVALPVLDALLIGKNSSNGLYLNGILQKISYWPQRLINAEVQAFSK